jgi:hypothetical protein
LLIAIAIAIAIAAHSRATASHNHMRSLYFRLQKRCETIHAQRQATTHET